MKSESGGKKLLSFRNEIVGSTVKSILRRITTAVMYSMASRVNASYALEMCYRARERSFRLQCGPLSINAKFSLPRLAYSV
jgi:hypothetical protein